jgi:hypothetical protein
MIKTYKIEFWYETKRKQKRYARRDYGDRLLMPTVRPKC